MNRIRKYGVTVLKQSDLNGIVMIRMMITDENNNSEIKILLLDPVEKIHKLNILY